MASTNRLTKVFGALAYFAFGAALFSLFILPTRTFQSALGETGLALLKFQALLVFLGALTGTILLFLQRFFSVQILTPSRRDTASQFGPSNNTLHYLNLALSGLLVLGTVLSLDTPLDIDENIHALMMTRGRFADELNPVKSDATVYFTQNHVLSQGASILAMKVFGFEKIPYRLPAVLFTLLLILAVWWLYPRLFRSLGFTFLLGAFLANAFFFWYLHSARGYVSLALVCFTSFLILSRLTSEKAPLPAGHFPVYVVLLLLSPFVHFFAMIFQALLLFALALHAGSRAGTYHLAKYVEIRRVFLAGMAVLPLYAVVLAHNVLFLLRIGDFEKGGESLSVWSNLVQAMGLSFDWQMRLWLAVLFLCLVTTALTRAKELNRFPLVFVGISVLFFAGALTLSETKVFEARFLLPFFAPLAFVLVDLLNTSSKKIAPPQIAGLLVLVVLPALSWKAVHNTITLNLSDFDEAMKAAKTLTAPVSEQCYLFSGKRDLSVFAKDFYLKEAKTSALAGEQALDCRSFYQVRLDPRVDFSKTDWPTPHGAKELWNNGRGMAIYRHDRSNLIAQGSPR